jgi:hypothetical protein
LHDAQFLLVVQQVRIQMRIHFHVALQAHQILLTIRQTIDLRLDLHLHRLERLTTTLQRAHLGVLIAIAQRELRLHHPALLQFGVDHDELLEHRAGVGAEVDRLMLPAKLVVCFLGLLEFATQLRHLLLEELETQPRLLGASLDVLAHVDGGQSIEHANDVLRINVLHRHLDDAGGHERIGAALLDLERLAQLVDHLEPRPAQDVAGLRPTWPPAHACREVRARQLEPVDHVTEHEPRSQQLDLGDRRPGLRHAVLAEARQQLRRLLDLQQDVAAIRARRHKGIERRERNERQRRDGNQPAAPAEQVEQTCDVDEVVTTVGATRTRRWRAIDARDHDQPRMMRSVCHRVCIVGRIC